MAKNNIIQSLRHLGKHGFVKAKDLGEGLSDDELQELTRALSDIGCHVIYDRNDIYDIRRASIHKPREPRAQCFGGGGDDLSDHEKPMIRHFQD